MFGLATTRKNLRPTRSRRTRLRLEALEARDCPSSLTLSITPSTLNNVVLSGDLTGASSVANQAITFTGAVAGTATTDANGHYSTTLQATKLGLITAADNPSLGDIAQATLAVQAPTFTAFTTGMSSGGIYNFTGDVSAPNFYKLTLTINDYVSLQNQAVTINPDGSFYYSTRLTTADVGDVTATVTDQWGQSSKACSEILAGASGGSSMVSP